MVGLVNRDNKTGGIAFHETEIGNLYELSIQTDVADDMNTGPLFETYTSITNFAKELHGAPLEEMRMDKDEVVYGDLHAKLFEDIIGDYNILKALDINSIRELDDSLIREGNLSLRNTGPLFKMYTSITNFAKELHGTPPEEMRTDKDEVEYGDL
ncbi:hypothetical protein Tco_0308767 [Tanacetum coccineum]